MVNIQTQALTYEIETGPLADTYRLFVPSTINTGSQISADRITDKDLRNIWFYTANVPLATKRNGKLLLGMGGNEAFNVVFGTNTKAVCQELIDTEYIHLTPAQKEMILILEKRGEIEFVESNKLDLIGQEAEYRQFSIRTKNYQKDITIARMPFVNAGYGSGYMLEQVMNNLNVEGRIKETDVFTMNPDHAAGNVNDNEIVARASGLGGFGNGSGFSAGVRGVGSNGALRGVRRVDVAEGDAKKNHLDELVGKGTEVHDVAVVRRYDITQEAWQLLTRKQ